MTHRTDKSDEDHGEIEVGEWLDMVENESKEVNHSTTVKRKVEEEVKKGPLYHYIGESSRLEHRRTRSHMLGTV